MTINKTKTISSIIEDGSKIAVPVGGFLGTLSDIFGSLKKGIHGYSKFKIS